MEQNGQKKPHVFISYSWTSQEHEDWVLNLAERLVNDGIDVAIDKWDLREGQDKYKFMERMVQDDDITKVLMICDEVYATKANERRGGVGDETQIISTEIYSSVNQEKFLPIIKERDAEKNPYLPHYLKPRLYIDFSNPFDFEERFMNLVRAINGKRLHTKPALGKLPSYITQDESMSRPTTGKLNAFRNAVYTGKSQAPGLAEDYLDSLFSVLTQSEVVRKQGERFTAEELKAKILDSVDSFLPYRDEFIEYMSVLCKYVTSDSRAFVITQRFFDQSAPYISRKHKRDEGQVYNDNHGFLIGELFLYTIASLIKRGRFDEIPTFLDASYQWGEEWNGRNGDYTIFFPYMENWQEWHRPANPDRYFQESPVLQMLKDRAKNSEITTVELFDADYALFLRSVLHPVSWRLRNWYPVTLDSYGYRSPSALPVFGRATSRKGFADLALLLDIRDKDDLVTRFEAACGHGDLSGSIGQRPSTCDRHRLLANIDNLYSS